MAKSDVEVMVPLQRKVKIGGQEYDVRPFSVGDVIYFTRELMEGLKEVKKKYPSMEFKQEDVLVYMPLLIDEAPRLLGLIGRAISKDKEWLEKQTDLVGVSDLFVAITEINDFGTIIGNFRKGWAKLQSQTIKGSAEQST